MFSRRSRLRPSICDVRSPASSNNPPHASGLRTSAMFALLTRTNRRPRLRLSWASCPRCCAAGRASSRGAGLRRAADASASYSRAGRPPVPALHDHVRTELRLAALTMATQRQRPVRGLICQSGHGSQYAASAGGRRRLKPGKPWVDISRATIIETPCIRLSAISPPTGRAAHEGITQRVRQNGGR